MSRIVRFFKKLLIPVLTHDAAQEAERRKEIAQKISDDQIYVQVVKNALNVPDASITDKLTFAFSSLPDAQSNFPFAKNMFFDILEFLETSEEITHDEVNTFKVSLDNINSLEELLTLEIT